LFFNYCLYFILSRPFCQTYICKNSGGWYYDKLENTREYIKGGSPNGKKEKLWRKLKVPKPMTFTTGEQFPAYDAIDDFFKRVREKIEESYPNWPHTFKIEQYPLYPERLVGKTGGGPTAGLRVLFCGDRPICSVLVTSTDLNNDHFSFALYQPRFPWVGSYRDYQREKKEES